jgi:hypothetical protein
MALDELTTTIHDALNSLSPTYKANFLLDTALALIQSGQYVFSCHSKNDLVFVLNTRRRYGPDVENYMEVYLRTPNLPKNDIARALLARGNARKRCGERLLAKAEEGTV